VLLLLTALHGVREDPDSAPLVTAWSQQRVRGEPMAEDTDNSIEDDEIIGTAVEALLEDGDEQAGPAPS